MVSTRPHAWLQDLYLYTSTSNHGIYYDAIVRDYQYAPPGLGFVYGGGIAGASLTQLGQWSNGTDTLTITDPADVVDAPEPAAWALMALGGLLLGGSLLTQKRLRTRDGAKVEE